MAEFKHAKYLQKTQSGFATPEVKLFHGDDVEDALKEGWTEPTGTRANGEPWNPEVEEDEVSYVDAGAEVQKANDARAEKIAQRKETERQKAAAESEKAQAKAEAENPPAPDFRVQVVEPQKAASKSTRRN